MHTPLALLLMLALATSLWAAPRLHLRWQQSVSPTPVIATAIWKRTPGPVEAWVLVRILPNDSPRLSWGDTAVWSGQEWCYQVQAMGAGPVLSAPSNTACGVLP